MNIIFHAEKIDVRGTCVSLYDYAYYNETLLDGRSSILTSKHGDHDKDTLYKFAKQFKVLFYNDVNDIEDICKDYDIFYTIKYGRKDKFICNNIKSVIHCVFDLSEPHGDVYAAVSDTLARKYNHDKYVPHMIGLKPSTNGDNFRKMLNIPLEAIVFGRHGGRDTFDLDMAKSAIVESLHRKDNLHFVFVNTPVFFYHPRIHHINKIVDLDEKNRFIMTCDAMIHAQSLGETFGLSIGEFSINNKPIISYNGSVWNDHYKHILKDNALWYTTMNECLDILTSFDPTEYRNKDVNMYKDYSPKNVMKKFKSVFIDNFVKEELEYNDPNENSLI